jgi:hypothetical protein
MPTTYMKLPYEQVTRHLRLERLTLSSIATSPPY